MYFKEFIVTEKELRRLSRKDLLELLIYQTKRANAIEQKCKKLEHELKEKNSPLNSVGSISQTALQLSGIFEAADLAARYYLELIQSGNNSGQNPVDIYKQIRTHGVDSVNEEDPAANTSEEMKEE